MLSDSIKNQAEFWPNAMILKFQQQTKGSLKTVESFLWSSLQPTAFKYQIVTKHQQDIDDSFLIMTIKDLNPLQSFKLH